MPTAHESWAWVYDEVYEKSFGSFYTNLTSQTLSVVDGLLAPGSSILDVGAGTGRLAIPLSERGYSITAIDASKLMLDVLRSKVSGILLQKKRLTVISNQFERSAWPSMVNLFHAIA